jgi:hypothetical protein
MDAQTRAERLEHLQQNTEALYRLVTSQTLDAEQGRVALDLLQLMNHQRALFAMLSSTSIKAAAEKVGLSERTLRRYLEEPHFKRAYDTERARMLEEAIASLQTLAGKAIATLGGVLDDEGADAGTKLRCARFVLDLMFRGQDMEHRHELEAIAEEFEQFRALVEPLIEEQLN